MTYRYLEGEEIPLVSLDDWDRIRAIDKEKMLEIQEAFPENCEDAVRKAETLVIPKKVKISDEITIDYAKAGEDNCRRNGRFGYWR